MEVESDEEDEKQEKAEEPPSQLDQDTQVQDMDEVCSWSPGRWGCSPPEKSSSLVNLERECGFLKKESWLSSCPSPGSTEPLSSSGNKDSFIGKDLKAVLAVFCDLPPLPRGLAHCRPQAGSQLGKPLYHVL